MSGIRQLIDSELGEEIARIAFLATSAFSAGCRDGRGTYTSWLQAHERHPHAANGMISQRGRNIHWLPILSKPGLVSGACLSRILGHPRRECGRQGLYRKLQMLIR
ncbi:hypothetical protein GQ53DRAFT_546779 [Thozetella sp. PMI_491]|nr:hypothetical protein GQ53DRAFT_546779 [Thozetella sp. PMI_491]